MRILIDLERFDDVEPFLGKDEYWTWLGLSDVDLNAFEILDSIFDLVSDLPNSSLLTISNRI